MLKYFTKRLVEHGVINVDEEEIYEYGLNQLLVIGSWIILSLLVSILFQEVVNGFIFLLAFGMLRRYAGGYHAETPVKCYILSITIFIVALSVMKFLYVDYFIYYIGLIISCITIILLAPVEAINKPLDEIEKKMYRRKTIAALFLEEVIVVVGVFLKIANIVESIMLAQCILGISLVAGSIIVYRGGMK